MELVEHLRTWDEIPDDDGEAFHWLDLKTGEAADLIEKQAAELASARAEIERLKTVPMKYRRMAFNAQLQNENAKLNQQLTDEQAKNVGLRRCALRQAEGVEMSRNSNDSCRLRNEARTFCELIQDKHTAKPERKKAPEGASCGTCDRFKKQRCGLKKKPVKHYNICGEWTIKPAEFVNLCVNGEIAHTVEITPFESKEVV